MGKGRRHSLHSILCVLLCHEFVQGKAALLLVFTVLQQYVIANRADIYNGHRLFAFVHKPRLVL